MIFTRLDRSQKEAQNLKRLLVRTDERPLEIAVMAFQAVCMLLLSLKDGQIDAFSVLLCACLPLGTYLGLKLITHFWPVDRAMYLITMFLCALSVILLRAVFSSTLKAKTQAMYLVPGFGSLLIGIGVPRLLNGREAIIKLAMPAFVALMLLPFGFTTASAARSWVNLGAIQFQPSELLKPATVLVLASGFSFGKKFGRWIVYALYGFVLCMILLFQRDLGAMLLYFLLICAMFTAGTGKWRLTLIALAAAVGFGALFISISGKVEGFGYIATRIDIWKNPWSGKHEESRQIVQGLMSVSSGGLFGAGLGLSYARKVAVVGSDYIFAAVCEEFGMVFAICVLLLCMTLMLLGMRQAMNARSRFHALLAFGCAFELISQTLLIVGGNLNILPLTGVTLPFVSEGGSSLVGSMLMMGMILGVSSINAQDEYDDLMRLTSGKGVKE